jgi:hypothetical protein
MEERVGEGVATFDSAATSGEDKDDNEDDNA